jgi:hypothetical protein
MRLCAESIDCFNYPAARWCHRPMYLVKLSLSAIQPTVWLDMTPNCNLCHAGNPMSSQCCHKDINRRNQGHQNVNDAMTEFRLLQPQKSLSQYKYYASTDTMFNFMWIYVLIPALRSLFECKSLWAMTGMTQQMTSEISSRTMSLQIWRTEITSVTTLVDSVTPSAQGVVYTVTTYGSKLAADSSFRIDHIASHPKPCRVLIWFL